MGPAAISPDGKWLAYVVNGSQEGVWIKQMATGSTVKVIPASDTTYNNGALVFSRDGNYLYCTVQPKEGASRLEQVPSVGGTPRTILTEISSPIGFSPDGNQFVFVRNSGRDNVSSLMIANADGSNLHALTTVHSPASFGVDSNGGGGPAWSPDGKRIAVSYFPGSFFEKSLAETIDIADAKATPLGNTQWAELRQMAWLPDGSGIVTEGIPGDNSTGLASQIWEIQYPDGTLRKITNDLNYYVDTSLTSDGNSMVTIQATIRSSLWQIPGAMATMSKAVPQSVGVETDRANGYMGTTWTAKGEILYGYSSPGGFGLAKMSPTTGDSQDLNFDIPGGGAGPAACGTKGYFVFMTKKGLRRADDDGGNVQKITDGERDVYPACSQDGKTVYYDVIANGQTRLWRVGIDGKGAVMVSDKNYLAPAISPDGKRIAVLDFADTPDVQLIVLDANSGKAESTYKVDHPMNFAEGQNRIAWTPDGKGIVFIVNDSVNSVSNLWEQIAGPPGSKAEPAKQITNFSSLSIWSMAWSPDAKQLLLSRGRATADAVMISHFH